MLPIHKILVATDFSEGANHALDYAASLAGALSRPLLVTHVYTPPVPVAPDGYVFTAMYDEGAVKSALGQQLAAAAAKARELGAPVVEAELLGGQAWEEIVRLATARGCDLIVLATHGRGGVPRFLLGSVADKVVRKAACPVLTIGPRA